MAAQLEAESLPQSPQVNNGQDVQCRVCNELLQVNCSPTFHFVFDVHVREWREGSKKKRKKYVLKFLKMVNTLYNEAGGFVLVHTDQFYLAFFDEQVDERLMNLLPDGSMFDESFRRCPVDDQHVSFQVVVPPSSPPHPRHLLPPSVLNFHSTVSLNRGRAKPSYLQMRHLLKRPHIQPDPIPSPFGLPLVRGQVYPFTENRSLQAKLATEEDLSQVTDQGSRGKRLLALCWNSLDMPDFVAAFSKQRQGGYYCVGLEEEKKCTGHKWLPLEGMGEAVYRHLRTDLRLWQDKDNPEVLHLARKEHVPPYEDRTGHYVVRGVRLSPEDQRVFRSGLDARLRSHMMWFPTPFVPNRHNHPSPLDVDCVFHPVKEPADDTNSGGGGGEGGGGRGGEGGGRGGGGRGAGETGVEVRGQRRPVVLEPAEEKKNQGGLGQPGTAERWQEKEEKQQQEGEGLVHRDLYMVEIRVGYYPGVCFEDRGGPEAYRYARRRNPAASPSERVPGVDCCKKLCA